MAMPRHLREFENRTLRLVGAPGGDRYGKLVRTSGAVVLLFDTGDGVKLRYSDISFRRDGKGSGTIRCLPEAVKRLSPPSGRQLRLL